MSTEDDADRGRPRLFAVGAVIAFVVLVLAAG
jgi:hypothetical protein